MNPEPHESRFAYSISQLCREFDLSPRTLRFYGEKGLVSPHRRNNTRYYSAGDRKRLKLILRGRSVGFSLKQIRQLLDLYSGRCDDLDGLREILEIFRDRLADLEQKREELERAICEIAAGCARIEQWVERVPSKGLNVRDIKPVKPQPR